VVVTVGKDVGFNLETVADDAPGGEATGVDLWLDVLDSDPEATFFGLGCPGGGGRRWTHCGRSLFLGKAESRRYL